MPNYRRQKEFYGGYLAKYMFLKKCRVLKQDPTVEFFRHAGALYNINDKQLDDEYEIVDEDEDENDCETDENECETDENECFE